MAIRVSTGQTTMISALFARGQTTQIKKIVVGRPISSAAVSAISIDTLVGVNTSGKTQGALLVYNATTNNFETATTLNDINQVVDGGTY